MVGVFVDIEHANTKHEHPARAFDEETNKFATSPILWYTIACLKKFGSHEMPLAPPVSQVRVLPLIVSKLTDS
jgi:hypothetical protein